MRRARRLAQRPRSHAEESESVSREMAGEVPRIFLYSRDANAAVIAHAFAQFSTAATREIFDGKMLRARAVSISRSGMTTTKYKRDATSKRCTVAHTCRLPCATEVLMLLRTTVKPPKLAGAALSGWPSDSAHNLKRVSRSSGSPLSRFSPSKMPRRTVALLPSPRHRGTCSTIEHENENGRRRVCLKNRSAASDTIRG
jgi:hypothetical protein